MRDRFGDFPERSFGKLTKWSKSDKIKIDHLVNYAFGRSLMKKEEKTELTKERILQAAIQEFGTNGYASSTLNTICNNHKISKGLIYHNYAGKEDLYLACIMRCFSEVTAYLKSKDIQDDLKKYMKVRLQYFSDHPLYARIFFEAVLQPVPELKDKIYEAKRELEQFNQELYRAAIKNIKLRKGITEKDAIEYYEIMQEMFNGYFSSSAYAGKDFNSLVNEHEQKLSKMLDFVIFGIGEKRE